MHEVCHRISVVLGKVRIFRGPIDEWDDDIVLDNWASNRVNVYFVGNVQNEEFVDPPAIGKSVDPRDALFRFPDSPFIILNDGGFFLSQGFFTDYEPQQVLAYNVAEHEMAHYLARFDNRTFSQPPNQRSYDSGEHTTQRSNLLWGGTPTDGIGLNIPGRADESDTESIEIWGRIDAGTWNNP